MTRTALALALALAVAPRAGAQSAIATDLSCQTRSTSSAPLEPNGHIAWPADDPVWTFDFYRPANRSTYNGTGLELRNVRFQGRKVFERASVPVLNVEYDPGVRGCGCFRDWLWDEVKFDAGPTVAGQCYAEPQAGAVRTTCETGTGGDVGSFTGVAVEDYGSELVLTAHMEAGWYRYRMKWHFYLDGRVWPEFSFAAADAVCTNAAHRHHAYWRFDFDLDETPENDVVREHALSGPDVVFETEANRTWREPADGVFWSVRDGASGIGYEVHPSSEDLKLPVDAFSKTDALVLRYKAAEIDDGQRFTGENVCAFLFEPYVDAEPLSGEDVVFWYRSSALHAAGNPYECDIVGPTLRPVGFASAGDGPPDAGAVELQAATPNPFSPSTTVRFRLDTPQTVQVALFDALGRHVRTLFEGPVTAGRYETVRIDGADLPPGVYVVRLDGETARASTRVVLAR